jgi:hypothetical protein
MATTLGPNFGPEVIAAGLGGLPFSWNPEGEIWGRENLTDEQNTALDEVIAAHEPEEWPPELARFMAPT